MDSARISCVGESIAKLGYDGIVAFDREEPEYETFLRLSEKFDDERYLTLLGICAGTVDYQLAGDAQEFWSHLEQVTIQYENLSSVQDVRDVLSKFMNGDVNARLANQKRDRLDRVFDDEFGTWFIKNYRDVSPLRVWEELADALDNPMDRKTVVFSMKVYDIITLILTDQYLDFPTAIPIPCDLQVKRVASTAGLVTSDGDEAVMSAWATVAEEVSDQLDQRISLLRIDSIVWQAGQIIGDFDPDRDASREALVDHFDDVGLDAQAAEALATELTADM